MEKRFQECTKIIQIWRYRWYLLIPFKWCWSMCLFYLRKDKNEDDYYFTGRNLLKILIGSAQVNMKWYFTSEEVFDRLGIKYSKNKLKK